MRIKAPNGKRIQLSDLPLVVGRLNCAHLVKEYAIAQRDLVFCPDCGTTRTVRTILAS